MLKKYTNLLLVILLGVISSPSLAQNYCTPTYNNNGHPQTGQPTPFFTHILRVAIADVDRSVQAPFGVNYTQIYRDFTGDTVQLTQTAKYPLSIELGNGANTQTLAVWIDYNQNGTFESVEREVTRTDVANVGDHKYVFTIDVPKNAVIGYTRMRIGTLYGTSIPDPCNNSRNDDFANGIIDWSQNFHDYTVEIVKPTIQQFKDVRVSHTSFDEIYKGQVNNEILRIEVETNSDGTLSPLNVDSFYFSLLGTTNPKDIEKARLFYTGKNPVFHTNNLLDSVVSPALNFTMSSKRDLRPGTNYFWLAYDVKTTALLENRIDGRCNGIHVVTKRVPSVVNPGGSRSIGYCVSKGNRSNFVYVRRVQFENINVFSTWNNTGYTNSLFRSTNVERGDSVTISVDVGNGVNNNFTKVWIDFNADGDFTDANEEILFDSITNASPTNFNLGPVTNKIKIPANAKIGPTRMRVISTSKADQPPYKPAPNPCDGVVEIGEVEDYTVNITEDGEPVADFIAATTCFGDSTEFIDRSYTFNTTFYDIDTWKWYFGDGDSSSQQNPRHRYANAGTYIVTLIANTNKPGSPDTIQKVVSVEKPNVDFSINTTLSKVPIYFTDATTGGNTVFWEWNFDDTASGTANASFLQNPTHIFDTTGSYDIFFKVRTLGGCEDSIVKRLNIVSELPPIANFSANDFEPYKTEPLNLADLSVNRPTSWEWTITPTPYQFIQSSSSDQNPTVSLDSVARYKITLKVKNSAGEDTLSRFFQTKEYKKPEADFSANRTSVKAGQIVSFLDLSTNDPTKYEWVFGDGDTSEVSNPLHQYFLTGDYTVRLKVSNPAGSDSETKIDYIEVSDEYSMCESDVKSSPLFKGTLYDSGGKNGNYENNTECGFLIQPSCAGPITLVFSEFALNSNDYVRIFDGTDNSGEPLHTNDGFTGFVRPGVLVANSGAVYIEMETDRAVDTSGFKLSWSAATNIKPKARVKGDTVGYVNSTLILTNTTAVGTGNNYYWDIDNDGVNDDTNSVDVTVMFSQRGTDSVRLVAQNCKGTDTVYHKIRVDTATKAPVARFKAVDTVIFSNDEVSFQDLSTQGPIKWKWEVSGDPFNYLFVNGTADTSRNPDILFFVPGYYTIRLVATNNIGSSQPAVKTNYILVRTRRTMCLFPFNDNSPAGRITDDGGEDNPYISRDCEFLINPCAKEIVLDFKSFDYRPGDYLRVYDGTDNTGTPLHTQGTNGFTFNDNPGRLTATSGAMYIEHDATGSNRTYQGFVADWSSVPFDPPKPDFDMPDTAFTGGNIAFFRNRTDEKGNPFVNYYWDFDGDGTVDDSTENPNYAYTRAGFFNVELKVVACDFSDSISKRIRVLTPTSKPGAKFSVSQRRAATLDVVQFKDESSNGPADWEWRISPPNYTLIAGNDTLPRMSINFLVADTYDVELWVRNQFGADSLLKQSHIIVFEYCEPSVVNPPTPQVGISFVGFGDISNNSEGGLDMYTDYAQEHETDLTAGGRQQITIAREFTSPSINARVWIDYDQNGVFNDSNEVAMIFTSTTSKVMVDTILVPKDALYGPTRMRVATSVGSQSNTPCGPNNFGEYEDYRVVIGPDNNPPVLTLIGPATVFTEVGYPYVDSGATAWDDVDGDISSKIVTVSTVDTTTPGSYKVTYTVSDSAGNTSDPLVRTVVVLEDQTKPVVTIKGDNPYELLVYNSFNDPGAEAYDNIDGDISSSIAVETRIDTARLGTYEVIYTAYDSEGNASDPATRVVEVVDTVKPVITLRGNSTVTLTVGDSYTEDSADVSDNYYNNVGLIISGNVNPNVVDTYYVYYDATDRSLNSAVQKVRNVIVEEDISIDSHPDLIGFSVYPSPAQDRLWISLSFTSRQSGKLKLVDLQGKVIQEYAYSSIQELNRELKVHELKAGMYLLEFESKKGNLRKPVVISR